ncbi:hypothetical protein [Shimazuella kribbensis]|uniref:hypothetical protein n=1 Tax=Shimazuella kribbensis TaxID=139808 RepID=UPI0012EB24CB|nr:hypothetical protein [Shimazuella kribbensis]
MPTSAETLDLLNAIVDEMIAQFSITRAEAVARINKCWHRTDLSSEDDLILHEDEYYWALGIYFGDVKDWSPDADRSTWTPLPKPSRNSGYWTIEE